MWSVGSVLSLGWNQRRAADWQPVSYDLLDSMLEYGSFYCGDLLFVEQQDSDILVYGYASGRVLPLARFTPRHLILLTYAKFCPLRSGMQFLLGSVSHEAPADYLCCPTRPGLCIDYSGQVLNTPWPGPINFQDIVHQTQQTLWQAYYRFAASAIPFDSPALVTYSVTDLSPPRPDSAYVLASLTFFPRLKDINVTVQASIIEKLHGVLRPLPKQLNLKPEHLGDDYLRVVVPPPANFHEAFLALGA